MTNSKNGILRTVLVIIALGMFGCTSHINEDISFSYDSVQRLPVVLGLYFSPEVSSCDNALASVSGPKKQFHIDEMTVKFWPKVFEKVFENVHVLRDISPDLLPNGLDLVAEVRCRWFYSGESYKKQGGREVLRVYWMAGVNFLITFSCPNGGHLKTYVIDEKDSLGYYDHAWKLFNGPYRVLVSKLFKKTGRVSIERILPDAEALSMQCNS